MKSHSKPTNPKDAIGYRKWRVYWTIPMRVIWELGVALLEGALKYGAFNWRVSGVRVSVYTDAAKGHIDQFIEGENYDPDSGLHHITKAIASLVVLRDGLLEGNVNDDRPPRVKDLEAYRSAMQVTVDRLFEKYPDPVAPNTQIGQRSGVGCDGKN